MSDDQLVTDLDSDADEGGVDRRELLKKGAFTAAATGVLWSAPSLKGLSLRPDYASAASGPGCTGTFTATVAVPHGGPNSTTTSDTTTAACGTTAHASAAWGNAALAFNTDDPARVDITIDKPASGCAFTGPVTTDGFTGPLGGPFMNNAPVVNANQITLTLWGDPNFEDDISIDEGGNVNFGISCT